MSKRTIASLAAGIVAAGAAAYETWNGANGWETAGLAVAAGVAIGVFAHFIIGKIAAKIG